MRTACALRLGYYKTAIARELNLEPKRSCSDLIG